MHVRITIVVLLDFRCAWDIALNVWTAVACSPPFTPRRLARLGQRLSEYTTKRAGSTIPFR